MRIKYILLILLQVLLLAGIIGYRQYWVETGDRILLRTAPVDPRDIFRGDYVRLSYDISTLDLDRLKIKESFKNGEKVFVTLEKDADGTFKAVNAGRVPPWQQKYIKGRVQWEQTDSRWEVSLIDDEGILHTLRPRWFWGFKQGDRITFCLDANQTVLAQFKEDASRKKPCSSGTPLTGTIEEIKETKFKRLNVEYGIESYFVEEGKGRAIETARNAKEVVVEVALRSDGQGTITALFMGGKAVK